MVEQIDAVRGAAAPRNTARNAGCSVLSFGFIILYERGIFIGENHPLFALVAVYPSPSAMKKRLNRSSLAKDAVAIMVFGREYETKDRPYRLPTAS